MDVVFSEESPRFADEVMSQSEHELHCERAWRNLLPELRMWLRELSGLKGSICRVLKVIAALNGNKGPENLSLKWESYLCTAIHECV